MKKNIYYMILTVQVVYFFMGFFCISVASELQKNAPTLENTREMLENLKKIQQARILDVEVFKGEYTAINDEQKKENFVQNVPKLTQFFCEYVHFISTNPISFAEKKNKLGMYYEFKKKVCNKIDFLIMNLPQRSDKKSIEMQKNREARRSCLQLLRSASKIGVFVTLAREHGIVLKENLASLLDDTIVQGEEAPIDSLKKFINAVPSIDQQVEMIEVKIQDKDAADIAIQILAAYFLEQRRCEGKESSENWPKKLSSTLSSRLISPSPPTREADADGNGFYTIENFGPVTSADLLISDVLGTGNIMRGLCKNSLFRVTPYLAL